MVEIRQPKTFRGLLLVAGAAIALIILIFATTMGAIVLGLILLAVVLYLVWVVGGRLNDWFRHGKPIFRGNWYKRSRGSSEADSDG